ncbi:MAG: VTT domain-containing protein [Candidatus Omnitrophota bacterium]
MRKYRVIILIVAFVLLSLVLGNIFSIDRTAIDRFFGKIPLTFSIPVFIGLYVAANFFIFWDIKDILKIVAAVIYGAYLSTALIYCAEIINAVLFFKLARSLGKNFSQKFSQGRFKHLYAKVGTLSFSWIVLVRLLPLIPYRVLDVCFGLSKVRLRVYLAAVILASLPRIFVIQFPLAAIGEISAEKMFIYFNTHPKILCALFLYYAGSIVIAVALRKRLR